MPCPPAADPGAGRVRGSLGVPPPGGSVFWMVLRISSKPMSGLLSLTLPAGIISPQHDGCKTSRNHFTHSWCAAAISLFDVGAAIIC
jgi:hypothetical protein